MENPEQAFVEYAFSHTDEAGGKWYTFKPEQNNLGDTYNLSWRSHPNLRWRQPVTIERLAQYENEGWNDAFVPEDVSPNYENTDIEKLLGIMEHKVDTLMKDTILLMGKSESVFRLATNEMYRPPSEPSRQEEIEHIIMNFVLDQEERIRQLEDYMQAITDEFMEFSSKVT
ncbi:hypothetical protein Tco_0586366 [Tanacetum coccineum]